MKKFLCFVLSAMVTLAASAGLKWGEKFSVGDLMYKVDNTSPANVSVVGLSDAGKAKSSLALTIPATVNYSDVTCNVYMVGEEAFKGAANITSVQFDYTPGTTVVYISAFENCTNLTFARFASSIGAIHDNAFKGCTKLKRVFIARTDPDSQHFKSAFPSNSGMTLYVSRVGDKTVDNYKNIDAFSVFSSIERSSSAYDFLFTDGAQMCVTKKPTGTDAGEFTMVGYYKNGTIAKDGHFVPACVGTRGGTYGANGYKYDFAAIADWACYENTDLKSIDLSKLTKLTRIPSYAFMGCTNLTEAKVDCASLTEISNLAFASSGLTRINVPAGVTYCNYSFVDNCSNLQEITVSEGNTVYSSYNGMMFSKDRTTLRVCPGGKTGVIREYDFPNEMIMVFTRAFKDCKNLTGVFLPYGVYNIETEAFTGCTSLSTVKIPGSITKMGTKVFAGDTSLKKLFFNMNNPLEIDETAFDGAPKTTLYVPFQSIDKYKAANVWKEWANVTSGGYDFMKSAVQTTTDEAPKGAGYTVYSTSPVTVNGVKYDGRVRLSYHSDCGTDLYVPDAIDNDGMTYNVYEVGAGIFADGKTEKFTMTLGDNILVIRSSAFKDIDKLTKIKMGEHMTTVYDNAFNGCSGLAEIEIAAVTPPYAMYENSFTTYETTTLRVPAESLAAYKAHAVWGKFLNIKAIGEGGLPGDVNGDGVVDVTDANILINVTLGTDSASKYAGADVTGDGVVDIADVNAVLNLILGK
ncbi:leucine-rich repeat protein [Sodaliphilus sp.]|uniref:leucine-rich repeat protein n=1 Tax=Sodaliphilus sp. TaxID=2815818 RepID=UPI00388D93C2